MPLTRAQIDTLLQLVSGIKDDDLDCDGCFEKIAEFAETELAALSLSDAMLAVKTHLECCPCCTDEYQALLEALRVLGG